MRLIEVSIISLSTFLLTSSLVLPLPEQLYYEQLYMLANDIFLYLYKETNGAIYYRESYDIINEKINKISDEIKLCIYFNNGFYEIETCEISKGYFLRSTHYYGTVVLGVGK